jgi:hypothetical protein
LRTDNVLAWGHPEQSIFAVIVGARRLDGVQYAPSVLISVTERLNVGIPHWLAIAIDDATADCAGRRHPDPDIRRMLLRRERYRYTGSVRTSLAILRRHISIF